MCGKTVLTPGFFGAGKPGTRGRASSATLSRRRQQRGAFFPFRRPVLLIIILGGMMIIGAVLLRQARTGPPRTEAHDRSVARRNMKTLLVALDRFHSDCGRYPTTREGLSSLVHNPGFKKWQGPYIFELKPDPWKHAFRYAASGGQILLRSAGADGIDGSPDDIRAAHELARRIKSDEDMFPADILVPSK